MFQSSLEYGSASSVRTAAVRAYVSYVYNNGGNDRVLRSLSDLVPAVIQVFYISYGLVDFIFF